MMGNAFENSMFAPYRIAINYVPIFTGVDNLEPFRRAEDGSYETYRRATYTKILFLPQYRVYRRTNSDGSRRFGFISVLVILIRIIIKSAKH